MTGIRTIEDIKDRCVLDEDTGCWLWVGATGKNTGRPAIWLPVGPTGGQSYRLSQVLTWIESGRLRRPDGRVWSPVVCGNPRCANPDHHRLRTKAQIQQARRTTNSALHAAKLSAACRGSTRKLTHAQRIEIRDSLLPASEVATRYGISTSYAKKILSGRHCWDKAAPVVAVGASVFALGGVR